MAIRPAAAQGHGMPQPKRHLIAISIDAGVDPIRGSIAHADGTSEPFWGWLELLEELGRLADDKPERSPPGAIRQAGVAQTRRITHRAPGPGTATEEEP